LPATQFRTKPAPRVQLTAIADVTIAGVRPPYRKTGLTHSASQGYSRMVEVGDRPRR